MNWTRRAKIGGIATLVGTISCIVISLTWLWIKTNGWSGVTPIAFFKLASIIAIVFASIGGTMAIFIVMVLRKNEKLDGMNKRN